MRLLKEEKKITEKLDSLFDELLKMRHQLAKNTGFDNYRDYKFVSLGRFDYTPEDCMQFHNAIQQEALPIQRKIQLHRKNKLNFESLRPYDNSVDIYGLPPLKPFKDTDELVDKTILCLNRLKPEFGEYLSIMRTMGHLDLNSRKGKAPGGYNCTLPEIGVPFVFMNAAGSMRDVITMVHEAGHAVHSFLMRDLDLMNFISPPSEVAELASMSMELFTMEHWDIFFENQLDLVRAKIYQLEKVLTGFSWITLIDKFQHWIYTHPQHTQKERMEQWEILSKDFSTGITDWTGYEDAKKFNWHRQIHVFEMPFYYIEYAFAQLGAIAIWKQYQENPKQAIANYEAALSLGYTTTIHNIYERAGISFDFSNDYVRDLLNYVWEELQQLYMEVETLL